MIGIQAPDLSTDNTILGKNDPGYGYAFFWCTPKLYELYLENDDIERMNWNIAPFTYVQKTSGKGVTGRQFFYGKLDEVKNQYWDQSYSYGEAQFDSKGKYDNVGDYELEENAAANTNYSRSCGKYRREYECQDQKKNKNYTSINFPVLRYSDVLLMIAEAENEINAAPTKEAYDCLNEVRRRAGIVEYTEGSLSKEQFRQAVKDERGMELCFEYTRRFDLIRWGEYITNMNALVSRAEQGLNWTNGNGTYGVSNYFNITSAYNYFPIPDSEMSVNNAITTNNPGW